MSPFALQRTYKQNQMLCDSNYIILNAIHMTSELNFSGSDKIINEMLKVQFLLFSSSVLSVKHSVLGGFKGSAQVGDCCLKDILGTTCYNDERGC